MKEKLSFLKDNAIKVAETAGKGIKVGSEKAQEVYVDYKIKQDRKKYSPIFPADLEDIDFKNKIKFVRICENDHHLDDSEACYGAIGFKERYVDHKKEIELYNFFIENVNTLGLDFYPLPVENIYYANPFVKDSFIALQQYFDFFKTERVNELQNIAEKLGAKSVKITLKEEEKSFIKQSVKEKATVKKLSVQGGVGIEVDNQTKKYHKIEVMCDVAFNKTDSIQKPELVYFKNESHIRSLVDMAMQGRLSSQKYILNSQSSFGMSIDVAEKIDIALDLMSIKSNASIKSEVETVNRSVMEYQVEF